VICLGDFGYMTGRFSWRGYPGISVNENTVSASDYHQALRAHHAKSYFRRMAERIPFAHVPDDHEWDINNVDWPRVSGNLANIDAFAEGIYDYMIGNPKNADNTGDTDPFYFRFLCGQVEVFVLCAVMHGKDPADVQRMVRDDDMDGQANCLGRDATGTDIRNQEKWLTSRLKASKAPWKLVLMPKQTLKSTNVNADSWSTYRVEMDRTLQTIHDDDSLKKSKLGGIVWGCGDWHSPGIHGSEAGVNGDTYDHIAITPCPLVGAVRDAGPPSAHTIFSYNGLRQPTGSDLDFYGLFGLFEPRRELAAASIMNFRGDVLASIDIRRRENKAMR
jgi:phosphodiesterase/alkaline phosphatase D-like protein